MDKILILNKSSRRHIVDAVKFLYNDSIVLTEKIEEFKEFSGPKFLIVDYDWDINYWMYSHEFISVAREIINFNGKIVLDYSLEADTAFRPSLIYFLEKYKEANLPFDALYLAYNNSYDIFKKEVRIRNFKLNTIYFPLGLVNTYRELSSYYKPIFQKYDYTAAEKDFLLLNRRISYNKFKPIHELVSRGWKDRTFMSAVSVRNNLKGVLKNNEIPEWNNTLKELELELVEEDYPLYTPFKKPLQLEDDFAYGIDITNQNYLYKVNPKWYEKCKVNIVQETWYNDHIEGYEAFDNMIHVTEKTWKAIALNTPFVVIGNRNIVKSLQAFGIRIDFNRGYHYYDDMNDDVRYKKALDFAQELTESYSDNWMREVALHNMRIFWNIDNHRNFIKKHFLDQLFYGSSYTTKNLSYSSLI